MYEIFVPVQLSNSKWNEFSADFFRLFSVNYNVGEMAIAVYLVSNKCVLSHLVVLVKLAALTKWLARSTSLRTPICGKEIEKWGIIPRKPRRKSAYDLFGPVYYFIVLLCVCFVSGPCTIYFVLHITCLCWKCRLNTNPGTSLIHAHGLEWEVPD